MDKNNYLAANICVATNRHMLIRSVSITAHSPANASGMLASSDPNSGLRVSVAYKRVFTVVCLYLVDYLDILAAVATADGGRSRPRGKYVRQMIQ